MCAWLSCRPIKVTIDVVHLKFLNIALLYDIVNFEKKTMYNANCAKYKLEGMRKIIF